MLCIYSPSLSNKFLITVNGIVIIWMIVNPVQALCDFGVSAHCGGLRTGIEDEKLSKFRIIVGGYPA